MLDQETLEQLDQQIYQIYKVLGEADYLLSKMRMQVANHLDQIRYFNGTAPVMERQHNMDSIKEKNIYIDNELELDIPATELEYVDSFEIPASCTKCVYFGHEPAPYGDFDFCVCSKYNNARLIWYDHYMGAYLDRCPQCKDENF